LIEMGIEAVRVVRLKARDGQVRFQQLGRALTSVGGQEDVTPVLFGEPGQPAVIGAVTLEILLLRFDPQTNQMVAVEADAGG
jgi:predicted aspartyl protease